MFKCKECGTEYDIKPDYCDCGNDTFEEIVNQEEKPITPQVENNNSNELQVQQEKPIGKLEIQNNKDEVQPKIPDKTREIKPYSIIIFVLCLILSVLVVLFAWNPKPADEIQNIETSTSVEQKDLPSIEKIWNNKLPAVSVQEKKTSNAPTAVKQNSTTEVKKASQPTPQPQKQAKTVTKQEQSKNVTQKTTSPKTTAAKTTTTTPQKVTPSANTVQKTVSANPQEIANYKIKLRNHIASKISFASIVGDGSCAFSFSVSSNGELTNKKPISLSDNDSLNEAVYNALRQVYSYSAPPTGYKSETLKLTVKMYNNNFEVSLN